MDQHFRYMLAAVVGAGVVIGTAGVFIYHQIYEERRRLINQQHEIRKLDETVSSLRDELESLRKLQYAKKSASHRRSHHRSSSTLDRETEYDMFSAVGTDDGSDEFFDLSDGDDDFDGIESLRVPPSEANLSDTLDDPVLAQFLSTVDVLLRGPAEDKRNAYRQVKEQVANSKPFCALWWRVARTCHSMAAVYALDGDLVRKKEVTEEGIGYAEKAIELDPKCPEAHKWYAILIGSRGEFQSMKDKIEDGFVFKQHVDIALSLSPKDASLFHLLGRFKYEVAMLTWIERKLASTLFAVPPAATVAEALADFTEAERLNATPWMENRLLLGKCCIAEADYATAVMWLDKAKEIPVATPDDEAVDKEVTALLNKYGGYRAN